MEDTMVANVKVYTASNHQRALRMDEDVVSMDTKLIKGD